MHKTAHQVPSLMRLKNKYTVAAGKKQIHSLLHERIGKYILSKCHVHVKICEANYIETCFKRKWLVQNELFSMRAYGISFQKKYQIRRRVSGATGEKSMHRGLLASHYVM